MEYDASLPASSCVDARAVGAEQRGPFSDDGLASSWFPSLSSFVLQVGLFAGLACGSWLFIVLRGPAAPPLPLNLDRPQHELVARACPQVEQSALSATAPDEAVPAALSCGADIAFAARRHISLSAGQSPVDADSKAGQAASGACVMGARASDVGNGASWWWCSGLCRSRCGIGAEEDGDGEGDGGAWSGTGGLCPRLERRKYSSCSRYVCAVSISVFCMADVECCARMSV